MGTHCGIAHNFTRGNFEAHTLDLATSKEISEWGKTRLVRRRDPRITRFSAYLTSFREADLVLFEDVQFQTYTLQTQLWSSLRAAVWLSFPDSTLFECVPVSTLKKFATGSGAATKEMMEKSLLVLHPELKAANLDANAIDAIWILKWAETNLSRVRKV